MAPIPEISLTDDGGRRSRSQPVNWASSGLPTSKLTRDRPQKEGQRDQKDHDLPGHGSGALGGIGMRSARRHASTFLHTRSVSHEWLVPAMGPKALGARALLENLFDSHSEKLGDAEGDRERGIELPTFDRIDALPRDADPLGEFDLAPTAFRTQDFYAILQTLRPIKRRPALRSPRAGAVRREFPLGAGSLSICNQGCSPVDLIQSYGPGFGAAVTATWVRKTAMKLR